MSEVIKLGSNSKFDKKINDLLHKHPLSGAISNQNSFGYVQGATTGDIPFNSNSYTLTKALSL